MQGEEAMTAPFFDIRQEVVDIDCLCGQDARLADNLQVAAGIGFRKVHLVGEEEPPSRLQLGAVILYPVNVHLVDIREYIEVVACGMQVTQQLFVLFRNTQQHGEPGLANLLFSRTRAADGEDGTDEVGGGYIAGLVAVDKFRIVSAQEALRRDRCGSIMKLYKAMKGIKRTAYIEVNQYAAKVK